MRRLRILLRRRLPRAAQRPRGGFTLVELLMALVTLALAGTAVMQGVVISARAVERSEKCAVALEAARGLADRIAATPLGEVVGLWGLDGTEGATFEVAGLQGGKVAAGHIVIVTDETTEDPVLARAFGLPRDLDGDGQIATLDVSATARVLPVLIEVAWGRAPEEKVQLPVIVVR